MQTTINHEKESTYEAYAHWGNLAKNVFQIYGVDAHEQPVWRQRLSRERWLEAVLERIEPVVKSGWKVVAVCTIGRESYKLVDIG